MTGFLSLANACIAFEHAISSSEPESGSINFSGRCVSFTPDSERMAEISSTLCLLVVAMKSCIPAPRLLAVNELDK